VAAFNLLESSPYKSLFLALDSISCIQRMHQMIFYKHSSKITHFYLPFEREAWLLVVYPSQRINSL